MGVQNLKEILVLFLRISFAFLHRKGQFHIVSLRFASICNHIQYMATILICNLHVAVIQPV